MNRFNAVEKDAWIGFIYAFTSINSEIEASLQENFQISHAEYEILLRLQLSANHRLRIQDLAQSSALSRSGVSRAVDRLEKSGYLQKVVAPEDKRGAYAELTADGLDSFEKIKHAHISFVKSRFLKAFNEEELNTMAELWRTLKRFSSSIEIENIRPTKGSWLRKL